MKNLIKISRREGQVDVEINSKLLKGSQSEKVSIDLIFDRAMRILSDSNKALDVKVSTFDEA